MRKRYNGGFVRQPGQPYYLLRATRGRRWTVLCSVDGQELVLGRSTIHHASTRFGAHLHGRRWLVRQCAITRPAEMADLHQILAATGQEAGQR